MSRIRSVHPGLFTDEHFVMLSADAKVFFIGLWTEADDGGVFEWKPLTLKMKLLAGSNSPVEPLLAELEAAGRIKRYEVEGKSYGAIRNFCRFQHPQKPRSIYPIPTSLRSFVGARNSRGAFVQDGLRDGNGSVRNDVRNDVRKPDDVRTDPDAQTRRVRKQGVAPPEQLELAERYATPTVNAQTMERERERVREEEVEGRNHPHHPETRCREAEIRASGDALDDDDDDDDLSHEFAEVIWPLFPRKVDRGRALVAYREARRTASLDQLRAGLEQFAAAAAGKERRHVARPENWLRNQRWLDEPDDERVPGGAAEAANGEGDYASAFESREHWRDRCELWFDETRGGPLRERWIFEAWGPPPGEPGCRCPLEVLHEFGWSGEMS